MIEKIEIIKGIHPGLVVGRELRKRNIKKYEFAAVVDEHPQTLTSVIKGNRRMNIPLALKIEKAFDWETGFLMILQIYYDIQKHENISIEKPDLSKIRPSVFWDTDISKIDWQKQKKAVLSRINERGNEVEKSEIRRFYNI